MQAATDPKALEKACDFLAAVLVPEIKPARSAEKIGGTSHAHEPANSSTGKGSAGKADTSSDAASSRDSDRPRFESNLGG